MVTVLLDAPNDRLPARIENAAEPGPKSQRCVLGFRAFGKLSP
jgi:hypothetical protein